MADDHGETIPRGIYNAASDCRRTLEECLKVRTLNEDEWAENRLADFNVWAANIGAFAKPLASLDGRLIHQPAARNVVTSLLKNLNSFAEECREIGKPKPSQRVAKRSNLFIFYMNN